MRQNHTKVIYFKINALYHLFILFLKEFMDTFHEGIGYYLDGDWKEATQWFHQAQVKKYLFLV